MLPLPPEIELLALCARPRLDEAAQFRWCDLVQSGLDWSELEYLARYHGLTFLLYRALASQETHAARPELTSRLSVEFRANAARNLYLTSEIFRVLHTFQEAGVPLLPFKGPTLSCSVYRNLAFRYSEDLDFLVHSDDVSRAAACLSGLGYRPSANLAWVSERMLVRWGSELLFRKSGQNPPIDLHWRLAQPHYPFRIPPKLVWDSVSTVFLGPKQVPSLAPEMLLLVLAIHGARHYWQCLIWLADIAWIVERYPELDWQRTLRLAEQTGCERPLFLALQLAARVLNAAIPSEVQKDRCVGALSDRVLQRLGRGVMGIPPTREMYSFTADLTLVRHRRLRHFFGLLLDPTEAEWSLLKLPAVLQGLYRPIRAGRLIAKYARHG